MYATQVATARRDIRLRAFSGVSRRRPSTANSRPGSFQPGHRHLSRRADDATDRAYTDALMPPAEAASTSSTPPSTTATSGRSAASARRCGNCSATRSWSAPRPDFSLPARCPTVWSPTMWSAACTRWRRDFLADQIERSRANLGVDTIDVFYLHNPETQLGFAHARRVRRRASARAFAAAGRAWSAAARSAGTAPPPGTASARRTR